MINPWRKVDVRQPTRVLCLCDLCVWFLCAPRAPRAFCSPGHHLLLLCETLLQSYGDYFYSRCKEQEVTGYLHLHPSWTGRRQLGSSSLLLLFGTTLRCHLLSRVPLGVLAEVFPLQKFCLRVHPCGDFARSLSHCFTCFLMGHFHIPHT